jgi:spore coat polysaccharide biosynthesis protein SpsF
MKTGIVIQARMNSTRLSGKIMRPIKGRAMLVYLLERLRYVGKAWGIIVATTYYEDSDVICNLCQKLDVLYVRGSEGDVLSRYIKAVERFSLDAVVRLTSDNPLVDPGLVDMMIREFERKSPPYDYLQNIYDSGYPLGYCVEVIRSEALKKAFAEAEHPYEHEHVTPYLMEKKEKFRAGTFKRKNPAPPLRLTVDTEQDFALISWILENLYHKNPLFSLDDVIELLEKYPEMVKINEGIKQKPLRGGSA